MGTYELSGFGFYLSQQSFRIGHRLLFITGVILQEPLILWVWEGDEKYMFIIKYTKY